MESIDESRNLFALLIPAYKPNEKLCKYIKELHESGYNNIVVVNDGSGEICAKIFEEAQEIGCRLVSHAVNLGKGRAIKDGINYIAINMKECKYIIQLDCEGIQNPESIDIIAQKMLEKPDGIVMGSRNYKSKNVWTSKKVTNYLTRIVMSLLCGVNVSDTKTSFRAYSVETAIKFITTLGERYDYETNILLESKAKEIKIYEVKVGDENFTNKPSHYNPLVDSFNLYKIFLKYIVVAMVAYSVELVVFRLLMAYLQVISPIYYTIIDNVIARICSSFISFLIQRKKVFKNKEGNAKTGLKFYAVTMSQMVISSLAIWLLDSFFDLGTKLGIDVVVFKMAVDFVLFILGFIVQREWVFKPKKVKKK